MNANRYTIQDQAARILETDCGTRHQLGERPDLCPKCQAAAPPKPLEPKPTHYILVEPWAVYVKEAGFFRQQGGHEQPWGRKWKGVQAESIEAARTIGEKIRRRE